MEVYTDSDSSYFDKNSRVHNLYTYMYFILMSLPKDGYKYLRQIKFEYLFLNPNEQVALDTLNLKSLFSLIAIIGAY